MSEISNEIIQCAHCGKDINDGTEVFRKGVITGIVFTPHEGGPEYCSEQCAKAESDVRCPRCGITYRQADAAGKLRIVHGEAICSVCRMTPCSECGLTREADHDSHAFKPFYPVAGTRHMRIYDNLSTFGHRYTVKWPGGEWFALAASGASAAGPDKYVAEDILDSNEHSPGYGRMKSAFGWKIAIDDLPEPCIAFIMTELQKKAVANLERERFVVEG